MCVEYQGEPTAAELREQGTGVHVPYMDTIPQEIIGWSVRVFWEPECGHFTLTELVAGYIRELVHVPRGSVLFPSVTSRAYARFEKGNPQHKLFRHGVNGWVHSFVEGDLHGFLVAPPRAASVSLIDETTRIAPPRLSRVSFWTGASGAPVWGYEMYVP